jgi:D-arabinose 1-dehydrogenase-like Zn-dependent alcohol dehydrogenase
VAVPSAMRDWLLPTELTTIEPPPVIRAGMTTHKGTSEPRSQAGELTAISGVGGLGLAVQHAETYGLIVYAVDTGAGTLVHGQRLGTGTSVDAREGGHVAGVKSVTSRGTRRVLIKAAPPPDRGKAWR